MSPYIPPYRWLYVTWYHNSKKYHHSGILGVGPIIGISIYCVCRLMYRRRHVHHSNKYCTIMLCLLFYHSSGMAHGTINGIALSLSASHSLPVLVVEAFRAILTTFIMSWCHSCDFFQVPPYYMELACNLKGSMNVT